MSRHLDFSFDLSLNLSTSLNLSLDLSVADGCVGNPCDCRILSCVRTQTGKSSSASTAMRRFTAATHAAKRPGKGITVCSAHRMKTDAFCSLPSMKLGGGAFCATVLLPSLLAVCLHDLFCWVFSHPLLCFSPFPLQGHPQATRDHERHAVCSPSRPTLHRALHHCSFSSCCARYAFHLSAWRKIQLPVLTLLTCLCVCVCVS